MIPIIDRYIGARFLKNFLSFFLILMLIFIIQTIWIFIDEFAGKGLDISVILKFLLYYSPKLIPLVLPLTVLLASIMTFGSLAEHYEFAALKSAGISLKRAMRSVFIICIILSGLTFYMTNTVIPLAEFKTYNLRKNLAKMKPALAISEGMFNDMGASTIKVSDKYGPDDRLLDDVIIHEKSKSEKNNIVIKADSGELKDAEITDGLQLVLYNGNRYEEIVNRKKRNKQNKHPHARVAFEKYTMNIDLSDFNNVDLNETKYNNTFKMQTVSELRYSIDSLVQQYTDEVEGFVRTTYIRTGAKNVIPKQDSLYVYTGLKPFVSSFSNNNRKSIFNQAKSSVKTLKSNLDQQKKTFFFREKVINLHTIYMYDKYVIGFSALLMFFVGAPLGAIIRKGGFGLPVVLALIIFLTYHFAGTFFKNSAEDGSIGNFMGTSVTSIVLLIFSISLVRRASADKSVFNPSNAIHQMKSGMQISVAMITSLGKRIFAKK